MDLPKTSPPFPESPRAVCERSSSTYWSTCRRAGHSLWSWWRCLCWWWGTRGRAPVDRDGTHSSRRCASHSWSCRCRRGSRWCSTGHRSRTRLGGIVLCWWRRTVRTAETGQIKNAPKWAHKETLLDIEQHIFICNWFFVFLILCEQVGREEMNSSSINDLKLERYDLNTENYFSKYSARYFTSLYVKINGNCWGVIVSTCRRRKSRLLEASSCCLHVSTYNWVQNQAFILKVLRVVGGHP